MRDVDVSFEGECAMKLFLRIINTYRLDIMFLLNVIEDFMMCWIYNVCELLCAVVL